MTALLDTCVGGGSRVRANVQPIDWTHNVVACKKRKHGGGVCYGDRYAGVMRPAILCTYDQGLLLDSARAFSRSARYAAPVIATAETIAARWNTPTPRSDARDVTDAGASGAPSAFIAAVARERRYVA